MADAGASAEDRERIGAIATRTEGVKLVHALRTRHIGFGLAVDLHIMVEGSMTVKQGHDVSEAVKASLLADGPDLVDVIVHLEAYEEGRALDVE